MNGNQRTKPIVLLITSLAILAAATGASWALNQAKQPIPELRTVEVANVSELKQLFQTVNYSWPPDDSTRIPGLLLKKLPQDFPNIRQTREKKALFLSALTPMVLHENRQLREQRELARLLLNNPLSLKGSRHGQWLKQLGRDYRVQIPQTINQSVRNKLLLNLDELPLKLVLAQAAIESGWGTSRFAMQGNSLFGQWTYGKNKGITPNQRDAGATHKVAAFPSLQASVSAYFKNINGNRAYLGLRKSRASMRSRGLPLDAYELAHGLVRYSQRGEAYVDEVRSIIRSKSLASLDGLTLRLAMAEPIGD